MSAQRLSKKSIRRIQRSMDETGLSLEVIMAWSHGGYWMNFVTADHRHGSWDKKTGEIVLHAAGHRRCYSTCPHGDDSVEQWAEKMRTGAR